MNRLKSVAAWMCLAVPLIAADASAVSTSYWTQTNEADFKAGTLESVVATNLGDLKLSRAVKTLLEQDPRISTVNKLAEAPDGTLYAATGPRAILLEIKDQKVSQVAEIPDATDILSLAFDKEGRLLIGTGGDKGRILRIDKPGEKPHEIFAVDGVQYIWAIQSAADGTLYAATGPQGQLFEIKPDGTNKVFFASDENNLLSLVSDGKDLLYVGTDPHGLVYRVNRRTGESFVLYNAAESEVTALVLDKQGNLYAATGEARDEAPTPAQNLSGEPKSGRPEGGATGVPLAPEKPDQPSPPAPPDPNPGRPDPIPKSPAARARAGAEFQLAQLNSGPARRSMRARLLAQVQTRKPITGRAAPSPFTSRQEQTQDSAPVIFAMAGGATQPLAGDKHKPHPGPPSPGPTPGKPQPSPQPPAVPQTAPAGGPGPGHQPTVDTGNTGEPRPEGNAVYKIDPAGFVTEIFRQPVLVLAMVENNGTLLLATGSEGQIYQVNPAADETSVLAKVDAKQVMCLLPAKDGNIYMGMANVGSIASMSSGFAARGTYTSAVLDATQISRFGKMQLHGSLPAGTALTVETRSGNVKEVSEKSWSKWSEAAPASEFLPVTSAPARFLQYRLSFTSKDGRNTPIVDDVTVAYQIPNMPPQIKAVHLTGTPDSPPSATNASGDSADAHRVEPSHKVAIAWEASDPNNDALVYSLYFRRGIEEPWILLKEKLTDTNFEWDTREVADGRYEVKVVASDANANAPGTGKTVSRVSDPVVVDNTPPIIGDLKWHQKGGAIHVDLRAYDRTSTVAAVDYVVDSGKEWQLVLPIGNIYDSPEETVAFDIPGLAPGNHQVTLRATDSKGNQSFENLFVKVVGPAASR